MDFPPKLKVLNYFVFVSPDLHFSPGRLVGELVGLLTGDGGHKSRHTHLHVQMVALRRTNVFSSDAG